MTNPRLLDLFCCAGGAGMGYQRAGFEVVGVDIEQRDNYPFEFHRSDAIEFVEQHGHEFDAIHASPPCQRFSGMTACRKGLADEYPDLIDLTRQAMIDTGKPWVIENVPRSPLKDPIMLCGQMFGRSLYRHRLFEASFDIPQPDHPKHTIPASRAGHWKPGTIMSIAGNVSPIGLAREIMEIDWTTRRELSESIPPYYTEYVGGFLRKALDT